MLLLLFAVHEGKRLGGVALPLGGVRRHGFRERGEIVGRERDIERAEKIAPVYPLSLVKPSPR